MKKVKILSGFMALCFLFTALSLPAQSNSTWQQLPNAPVASRHNDLYFINEELGWIANGAGQIYRTTDGGGIWEKQFEQSQTHFRCIGFVDSLNGWAGNVGFGEFGTTDTTVLYHTIDGGAAWQPFNDFEGPKPIGLCGMYVLNDSTIFTVGRVRGPAFFARTINRGQTWVSKDLNHLAAGLIDVFFFTPDSGLAVGLTNSDHTFSSGIVLATSDGGESWQERHVSNRNGEWCWKMSFPSRRVGYVSLQRNQLAPIWILKTTDGGKSWENQLFSGTYYFVQGIGFATEEHGWIGGNSSLPVFETKDGGETWQAADFGARNNRFRFLREDFGYSVGRTVYKYAPQSPVSVATPTSPLPVDFALRQNYPNPFNPTTMITYELTVPHAIELSIYNLLGVRIRILVKDGKPAGVHTVHWDAKDKEGKHVSSGIYVYVLKVGKTAAAKRMLLLR